MKLEEEDIIRERIAKDQDIDVSRYKTSKGWFSTSLVPGMGRLFVHVKDGIMVKFKMDTFREHEGIVYAVSFRPESGTYSLEVYSYEYQIMGEEKEIKKYAIPMLVGSEYEKIKYE
jgi:hypothetical protein